MASEPSAANESSHLQCRYDDAEGAGFRDLARPRRRAFQPHSAASFDQRSSARLQRRSGGPRRPAVALQRESGDRAAHDGGHAGQGGTRQGLRSRDLQRFSRRQCNEHRPHVPRRVPHERSDAAGEDSRVHALRSRVLHRHEPPTAAAPSASSAAPAPAPARLTPDHRVGASVRISVRRR